jgi:hypothetical protein
MRSILAAALTALTISSVASAQSDSVAAPPPRAARCDGLVISHVEFRRAARTVMDRKYAPGWARALVQPLLLGTPTRESAVKPYLQLHDGDKCSEERRSESERLLRQLPYIADASVQVFDEADGRVRVQVETVDDVRPIIGLSLHESKPSDIELGNTNIGGYGHLAAVRWHQGGAFRDGYGVRYADYHVFGGPNVANVALVRNPLGDFMQLSLGRPFYTDLQHVAGYVGYLKDDGFQSFTRQDGDPLSIKAGREHADAGLAFRLNTFGTVSYLIGALASFEKRTSGRDAVLISDKGLLDTTNAELTGRYREQKTTRAGLVIGVRALKFVKASGFDGLEGAQDIARGAQLSGTVGKGITGDDRRPFLTADFYTGVGTIESFVGLRVQAEARQNAGGWGNGVASGRLAWYSHPGKRQTQVWSLEYAGSSSDSVPYQLTIADVLSGMRGYTGSRVSGGRRLIGRGERRFILPGISRYLGWGVAGFADAGQMWASKVPFGESAFRASAGLSLLVAVPRESRSVARVDFAFPIVKDRYAKGVDIRVTYRVNGRTFWREPTQISRARLSSPTTDIFSWP